MSSVIWATPAAADLQDIVDYLLEDSASAAQKFLDRIEQSVGKLAQHPKMGRVVPELSKHNITRYREVVISPWRAFYRTEGKQIYILAVIDGRRNIEDILLRRLVRE